MEVAACVVNLSSIADIGSDHAYLSKYLLDNGHVDRVLNVEVRQGPYDASCKTLAAYLQNGVAKVILSYGIDDVSPAEADAVIIAGMGGSTIIDILNKDLSHTRSFKKLVLQPQHAIAEVRKYLIGHSFHITQERIAREGDKFYEIICAVPAKSKQHREEMYYHIPSLCLGNPCENLLPFLKHKQMQQEKIIAACQKKHSRSAVEKNKEARQRLAELNKIIASLKNIG